MGMISGVQPHFVPNCQPEFYGHSPGPSTLIQSPAMADRGRTGEQPHSITANGSAPQAAAARITVAH